MSSGMKRLRLGARSAAPASSGDSDDDEREMEEEAGLIACTASTATAAP